MARKLEKQEISESDIRRELEEKLDRDGLMALCLEIGLDRDELDGLDKSALVDAFLARGSLEGLLQSMMEQEEVSEATAEASTEAEPEDSVDDLRISREDLKNELVGYWDLPTLTDIAVKFDVEFPQDSTKEELAELLLGKISVRSLLTELMEREAMREEAVSGEGSTVVESAEGAAQGEGSTVAESAEGAAQGEGSTVAESAEGAAQGEGSTVAESAEGAAQGEGSTVAKSVEGAAQGEGSTVAESAEGAAHADAGVKTSSPPAEESSPLDDDMAILRQMRALRNTISYDQKLSPDKAAEGSDDASDKGLQKGIWRVALLTGVILAFAIFGIKPLMKKYGVLIADRPVAPVPSCTAATAAASGGAVSASGVVPSGTAPTGSSGGAVSASGVVSSGTAPTGSSGGAVSASGVVPSGPAPTGSSGGAVSASGVVSSGTAASGSSGGAVSASGVVSSGPAASGSSGGAASVSGVVSSGPAASGSPGGVVSASGVVSSGPAASGSSGGAVSASGVVSSGPAASGSSGGVVSASGTVSGADVVGTTGHGDGSRAAPLALPDERDILDPTKDVFEQLGDYLADPDVPVDFEKLLSEIGGDEQSADLIRERVQAPVAGTAPADDGIRLLALGELHKAESELKEALWKTPKGPERARVFLLLAKARRMICPPKMVLNTYFKAMKEDPDNDLAVLGYYRVCAELGVPQKGIEKIDAFLRRKNSIRLERLVGYTGTREGAGRKGISPAGALSAVGPSDTNGKTGVSAAKPVGVSGTSTVKTASPPIPTGSASCELPASDGRENPQTPCGTRYTGAQILAKAAPLEKKAMWDFVVPLWEEALRNPSGLDARQVNRTRKKLADYYVAHGEPGLALDLYLLCEPPGKVTPDRALALSRLARETGRKDIEIRYSSQAAKAPKRDFSDLLRSARQYESEHRYQDAAALYREIIETPGAPRRMRASSHLGLAFCLRVLKRYSEARAQADKAACLGLTIDPGFKILLDMER